MLRAPHETEFMVSDLPGSCSIFGLYSRDQRPSPEVEGREARLRRLNILSPHFCRPSRNVCP